MGNLFQSLFFSFRHPFKFASYMGDGRFISQEQRRNWLDSGIRPLQIREAIVLSWIFKIISGILVFMLLSCSEYLTLIHPGLKIVLPSKIFIIYLGFSTAFFPLQLLITMAIWKVVIRIFASPFLEEDEIEKDLEKVLSHSLSSNVMILIPFLGPIFQELLWPYYLFAGLKNTYQLNFFQSMSFFLLFAVFFILFIMSVFLSIAMIFFTLLQGSISW